MRSVVVLFSALGVLFISSGLHAAQVTISFDDIAAGGYSWPLDTPQGYQLGGQYFGTVSIQDAGSGDNFLQVRGTYDGTPLLTLTNSGGLLFSMQQMDVLFEDPDLCNLSPDCIGTAYSLDVFIQAEDALGNVIADMTVLHSEGLGWRTVTFDSAWTDIATVKVSGSLQTSFTTESGGYDNIVVTAVPVPAAAWLFGSALAGLGWFRRRQNA